MFNMHIYTSTIRTVLSKFVRKIYCICPAHQPLCVPLQGLLQDTAAPLPPSPAAAPAVRARVSLVLPLLLFSKADRLLIRVVPRRTDCFAL